MLVVHRKKNLIIVQEGSKGGAKVLQDGWRGTLQKAGGQRAERDDDSLSS